MREYIIDKSIIILIVYSECDDIVLPNIFIFDGFVFVDDIHDVKNSQVLKHEINISYTSFDQLLV